VTDDVKNISLGPNQADDSATSRGGAYLQLTLSSLSCNASSLHYTASEQRLLR